MLPEPAASVGSSFNCATRNDRNETIWNLQLLRAVAATGVVFYHCGFQLGGQVISTELQGVAIFFVITGFLMPRVSAHGALAFIGARVSRVMPAYWFATVVVMWFSTTSARTSGLIVLALALASLMFLPSLAFKSRRLVSALVVTVAVVGTVIVAIDYFVHPEFYPPFRRVAESALLIPVSDGAGQRTFPILAVGWTLIYEMYFYVVYFVAMLMAGQLAPLVAGSLVILVKLYVGYSGRADGFCAWFGHEYVDYFCWGLCLNFAYDFWILQESRRSFFAAVALISAALALMYAVNFDQRLMRQTLGFSGLASLATYVTPVVVVLAALKAESAGLSVKNKVVMTIGSASFMIYLLHQGVVLSGIARSSREFPSIAVLQINTPLGCPIAIAVSIVIGVFVHQYLEAPCNRKLRMVWGLPSRPL